MKLQHMIAVMLGSFLGLLFYWALLQRAGTLTPYHMDPKTEPIEHGEFARVITFDQKSLKVINGVPITFTPGTYYVVSDGGQLTIEVTE